MQDTIAVLKKMIRYKFGQIPNKAIESVFTTTVYILIEQGRLDVQYPSEKEAAKHITNAISKSKLEDTIKIRYKKEAMYDPNPGIAAKWGNVTLEIEDKFNIILDKKKIGLYKEKSPVCECGNAHCEFLDGYEEHIRKRPGMIWFCPECGASVGVHRGTDIPLGVPAGKDVRILRISVHNEIDRLIDSGLSKKSIYKVLRRKMELKDETTHAGMFTKKQCKEALAILSKMQGGYKL